MYQYGLGAKTGQGVACLQEINAEYLVDCGNVTRAAMHVIAVSSQQGIDA